MNLDILSMRTSCAGKSVKDVYKDILQVAKAEIPQEELMRQYPQICGFHFVSSLTGQVN